MLLYKLLTWKHQNIQSLNETPELQKFRICLSKQTCQSHEHKHLNILATVTKRKLSFKMRHISIVTKLFHRLLDKGISPLLLENFRTKTFTVQLLSSFKSFPI